MPRRPFKQPLRSISRSGARRLFSVQQSAAIDGLSWSGSVRAVEWRRGAAWRDHKGRQCPSAAPPWSREPGLIACRHGSAGSCTIVLKHCRRTSATLPGRRRFGCAVGGDGLLPAGSRSLSLRPIAREMADFIWAIARQIPQIAG
jgi:hypothetical protein